MTSGLLLKYVSESIDKEHNAPIISLEIKSYKDQASKQLAKHNYLSSSKCVAEKANIKNKKGDKCPCRYVDPVVAMKTMLKMR